MKMSKNYKRLCLVLGLSTVIGTGALAAKSGTETKQATYRNIQVTYNGAAQSLSLEPFLIDGSVYVPLRAFGDIVGVNATWAPASNTVILTGGSSSSTAEAEIAQLNYKNTVLQLELNAVKAELASYKENSSSNSSTTNGTNISATELKKTQQYLYSTYSDNFNNINFDFDLSQISSRLDLTISYASRSENTAFDKISEYNIQKFIKKVCDDIAATHTDIEIQGIIEYSNDNQEKVSFTRTKTGKYEYNFGFDISDIEEIIEDETNGYITLDNLGKMTINSTDIDIRESKTTINVKLYLSTEDTDLTEWNKLNASEKRAAVKRQLEDIQEEIIDKTSYDVNILIYSHSNKIIAEIDSDAKTSVY